MKEKVKSFLNHTIVKNCIRTFFQGFFGALAVTIVNTDLSNRALVISTLIGAVSSGICAVSDYFLKRREAKNASKSKV